MVENAAIAEAPRGRRFLPELVLVGLTLLWGATFLITKIGLDYSGPLFFLGLRFAIATILLLGVSPGRMRGVTRFEVRSSAWVALAMVVGYVCQTIGLLSIASSKSAFISALYVPLVPVIGLLFLGERPGIMVWLGIGLAFFGLVLLSGPEQVAALTLGQGELATLVSALAFSAQIVLMGLFAKRIDAGRAAVLQVGLLALASFALMPLFGEQLPPFSWPLAATAGGLGVASALIQVMMNWGQRYVSPSRAALIYAAEPVWAGMIGWVAGERLPTIAWIGAGAILLAVVVSEIRLPAKARRAPA